MKKIFGFLFLMMLPALVLGATIGGLYLAGVVDKPKLKTIYGILKGQKVFTVGDTGMDEQEMIKLSKDLELKQKRLEQNEKNLKEMERVGVSRQMGHANMEAQVRAKLQEVKKAQKKLEEEKEQFQQQRDLALSQARDADFRLGVQNFEGMSSRKAARIIFDMRDPLVLRYLRAMKKDVSSEILATISKIDDEKNQRELPAGPDNPTEWNRAAVLQGMLSGENKTGDTAPVGF